MATFNDLLRKTFPGSPHVKPGAVKKRPGGTHSEIGRAGLQVILGWRKDGEISRELRRQKKIDRHIKKLEASIDIYRQTYLELDEEHKKAVSAGDTAGAETIRQEREKFKKYYLDLIR